MVPAVASLPPVPCPPVSAPLWCGDPRGSSGLHLKWELLCLCVPPRGFFPRPGYPQGVPTGSLDVGGRRNQGVIASATPPSLRPFGDRFHKVLSVSQLLMLVTSSIIHPFFVWGWGALFPHVWFHPLIHFFLLPRMDFQINSPHPVLLSGSDNI